MPPEIKEAFKNLQIAILQTLISDETSAREADAYKKMSRLALSLQRDYEELFDAYKQTENKKLAANEPANQQLTNMSIKLYHFNRRV